MDVRLFARNSFFFTNEEQEQKRDERERGKFSLSLDVDNDLERLTGQKKKMKLGHLESWDCDARAARNRWQWLALRSDQTRQRPLPRARIRAIDAEVRISATLCWPTADLYISLRLKCAHIHAVWSLMEKKESIAGLWLISYHEKHAPFPLGLGVGRRIGLIAFSLASLSRSKNRLNDSGGGHWSNASCPPR